MSLAVPVGVVSRARRVANGFRELTGAEVDADVIIAGRAGLLGHAPRGRIRRVGLRISCEAVTGGVRSRCRVPKTSTPYRH